MHSTVHLLQLILQRFLTNQTEGDDEVNSKRKGQKIRRVQLDYRIK